MKKFLLAVAIVLGMVMQAQAQCGASAQQQQAAPRTLASQADLAALARAAQQVAQPETNLVQVAPRPQARQQITQRQLPATNLQIVDDLADGATCTQCEQMQQRQQLQQQPQQNLPIQSRAVLPQRRVQRTQAQQPDRFTQTYSVSRSSMMQFTGARVGDTANVAAK